MTSKFLSLKSVLLLLLVLILIISFAIFFYKPKENTNSVLGSKDSVSLEYRIGSVLPLSRAGTGNGLPYANGIKLAVDTVNKAGGVNGKQIKLDIQDGQLDPQISLNAYKFLTKDSKPDAVTTIFAPAASTISQPAQSDQVPFIYNAHVRNYIENKNFIFKNGFDVIDGCKQLISYAQKIGSFKKLGITGPDLVFNQKCAESIFSIEPSMKMYLFGVDETDYKNIITKAESDGIDTLMITGFDYHYQNLFKQLSDSKSKIKVICAVASECIFTDIIKSVDPSVLNNVISVDYLPIITQTNFSKTYLELYPNATTNDLSWASAGYEDGKILAKAFESCQPGDRVCIKDSLEKVSGYDNSAIGSKGFKDHIMQVDYTIYRFLDEAWKYESAS